AMVLYLFYVDKEGFTLGGLCVGITHKGCERVSQKPFFGYPFEAPVNRNAHLVHLATIDIQGANTLGHDTGGNNLTALAVDAYLVTVADTLFGCQFFTNLDKRCRLNNGVTQGVLSPEMVML